MEKNKIEERGGETVVISKEFFKSKIPVKFNIVRQR